MLQKGFEKYNEYFDNIVSLMLINDEDGVLLEKSNLGGMVEDDESCLLDAFCSSVLKKLDAKKQFESYSLLRKAIYFFSDDHVKKEMFRSKLFAGLSLIEKDPNSPLLKILR